MENIVMSFEQLVGRTPLMRLSRIEKAEGLQARLLAKLEYPNPTGSTKARAALQMVLDAEAQGLLKPGATIIEPTSGNTGVGLCAVAATRGYKAIIVMPDSMSMERRMLMKAYGAELVLTDGKKGMSGAIEKANELHAEIPNSFIPGQFDNPSNAKAHYLTTGPEIWRDTDGHVDFFVAGVGTGGTITGVGHYLKEQKPDVKVIAVEPATSAVLSGGKAGAHKLQGIGAGFVPKVLDTAVYDAVMPIDSEPAFRMTRMMARTEGLLVGISSGAALATAVDIAKRPENAGRTVVVLLPDTGERYLSTGIFDADDTAGAD